jgi:hypothetical protein
MSAEYGRLARTLFADLDGEQLDGSPTMGPETVSELMDRMQHPPARARRRPGRA